MTGFRFGRIYGFNLRIDFSWFIVFFLILWTFAIGVFPANLPGLSNGTYLAMGFATTLVFFASLLIHEVSHSLVARSKGIHVDGITLFIFGGVAHTREEAATPKDEFSIAAAGPLASLALTTLFAAAYVAGRSVGLDAATLLVIRQSAILNAAVAVFNLLPGFPLDGGRLFRALVWRLTGDFTRATRIAAIGGASLGYLLVALGVWRALAGRPISGLWLVFVGWFLRNTALSSYREHLLAGLLSGARAAQIMISEPVATETLTPVAEEATVRPTDSLTKVMDGLRSSPARRVLVVENQRVVGIITAGDVASWLERARLTEKS